jgi:hypothetical protein
MRRGLQWTKSKDLTQRARRKAEENRRRQRLHRREAQCAEKDNAESAMRASSWQAGAQPFDSAPPNLRMHRAVARFTGIEWGGGRW